MSKKKGIIEIEEVTASNITQLTFQQAVRRHAELYMSLYEAKDDQRILVLKANNFRLTPDEIERQANTAQKIHQIDKQITLLENALFKRGTSQWARISEEPKETKTIEVYKHALDELKKEGLSSEPDRPLENTNARRPPSGGS